MIGTARNGLCVRGWLYPTAGRLREALRRRRKDLEATGRLGSWTGRTGGRKPANSGACSGCHPAGMFLSPMSSRERIVYSTQVEAVECLVLRAVDGSRVGVFPVSDLERMKSVILVRNRKGRAVRAQMRPLSCHVRMVLSKTGTSFQQKIEGAQVWALRGVTGSGQ